MRKELVFDCSDNGDDAVHRGNTDGRSVRAFAVKPRAFGAPLRGLGA